MPLLSRSVKVLIVLRHHRFLGLYVPQRPSLPTFLISLSFSLYYLRCFLWTCEFDIACNNIWFFITASFTRPRSRGLPPICISTDTTFRSVHSEVRRCYYLKHILTIVIMDAQPIISATHLWVIFGYCLIAILRLISADFTGLITN